jgi:hypothetical protein
VFGGKTEWAICPPVGVLRCLAGEEASVAGAVGQGNSGCRGNRWGYEGTTLLDCQQQGLPKHQRMLVWSTRRTVTTRSGDVILLLQRGAVCAYRVRVLLHTTRAGMVLGCGCSRGALTLGELGVDRSRRGAPCFLGASRGELSERMEEWREEPALWHCTGASDSLESKLGRARAIGCCAEMREAGLKKDVAGAGQKSVGRRSKLVGLDVSAPKSRN